MDSAASRRFIAVFLLPLLLGLPVGLANVVFLWNAGELDGVDTIAAVQQEEGGLYGTALHANVYRYKMALYAARRPAVVVIGSSRVLQMRQRWFDAPFVNLGRTVNYPAEAGVTVADMLSIHRPDLVLFGIDPWWLNPSWEHAPDESHHRFEGGDLTPEALVAPLRWLADGRLAPATWIEIVTAGHPIRVMGEPMFGVRAVTRQEGFGPDGSLYRTAMLYGRRPGEDPGFADTLRRIALGKAQFPFGAEADRSRIAEIEAAVAGLEAAGVEVVLFAPPVAPSVHAAMAERGADYGYLAGFHRWLDAVPGPHLDAWDPARVGADDCEFTDGFHGGGTVALRLLAVLADAPGSPLAGYLDRAAVAADLAASAGAAQADHRYRGPGERETDFLRLGCAKTPG